MRARFPPPTRRFADPPAARYYLGMDDTGGALRRAILEDPWDEAPRLIFADWLQENGNDAGAAFIRSPGWLAYARHKPGRWRVWCGDRPDKINEPVGLALNPNARLVPLVMPLGIRRQLDLFTVWRGFVQTVACSTAAFVLNAEALFAAHPLSGIKLIDRDCIIHNDGGPSWAWYPLENHSNNARWLVPRPIWRRLAGFIPRKGPGSPVRYLSAEAAHQALSDACVRYGRFLAGLPAHPYDTEATRV